MARVGIYDRIAKGLYNIHLERVHNPSGEAKVLILMMTEISRFFHSGSDFDKESAKLYFDSDDFLYHCQMLALSSKHVKELLTQKR